MTDMHAAAPRYVVQAGSRFLRLTGPFAYHDFTASLPAATLMSWARACQCAAAFGGSPVVAESVPTVNGAIPPAYGDYTGAA